MRYLCRWKETGITLWLSFADYARYRSHVDLVRVSYV
jgi:hypothetical protein